MQFFWCAQEQIPSDIGFSLYSMTHWFWIFGISLGCTLLALCMKKTTGQFQQKILCSLVWTMVLLECAKDMMLIITDQFRPNYLPLDLCGLSIFLELAAVYFAKPFLYELIYSLSLPGAVLALLYPNWNSLPIWSYMSLHSFLLHGILTAIPIMMLASSMFSPNIRRLPICLLCLMAASVPIIWINSMLGTNFFFLARPSKGSPLVWFEKTMGNHLIGLPIMITLVWLLLYGLPIFIRKIKNVHRLQ